MESVENGLKCHVQLEVRVYRDGRLVDAVAKERDLVVNGGLDLCIDSLGKSGANRPDPISHIAIGTDGTAPTASDTALGNEVMREAATYTKTGTGQGKWEATFNITGSYTLQEAGLFNAATGGTMFCRDTFSARSVESGDTVTVVYTVSFSAG